MSTSRLTARLAGLVRPLYTLPLALSNTVDWSSKSCLHQRACILMSICVCRYNYNFRTNINWLGQTNGYLGKVSVDVEPARLNAARPECSLNLQSPCEFQGNIISTMPTVQALDFSVIDFSSFYQNYVGFPPTNAVSLIHMPSNLLLWHISTLQDARMSRLDTSLASWRLFHSAFLVFWGSCPMSVSLWSAAAATIVVVSIEIWPICASVDWTI